MASQTSVDVVQQEDCLSAHAYLSAVDIFPETDLDEC